MGSSSNFKKYLRPNVNIAKKCIEKAIGSNSQALPTADQMLSILGFCSNDRNVTIMFKAILKNTDCEDVSIMSAQNIKAMSVIVFLISVGERHMLALFKHYNRYFIAKLQACDLKLAGKEFLTLIDDDNLIINNSSSGTIAGADGRRKEGGGSKVADLLHLRRHHLRSKSSQHAKNVHLYRQRCMVMRRMIEHAVKCVASEEYGVEVRAMLTEHVEQIVKGDSVVEMARQGETEFACAKGVECGGRNMWIYDPDARNRIANATSSESGDSSEVSFGWVWSGEVKREKNLKFKMFFKKIKKKMTMPYISCLAILPNSNWDAFLQLTRIYTSKKIYKVWWVVLNTVRYQLLQGFAAGAGG